MIARILLTGGPHGGKSTMLTRIRQLLQSLGVKVVAVPESATNLIGMLAPGDHAMLRGNDMLFAFQVAVLKQQAANERLAEKMAQALEWPLGSEDVVATLFDRSVLDGEVFVDGLLDWTLVTQTAGVQLNDNTFREDGMPAFDVVLHLGSCAVEGEGASPPQPLFPAACHATHQPPHPTPTLTHRRVRAKQPRHRDDAPARLRGRARRRRRALRQVPRAPLLRAHPVPHRL